MIIEESTAGSTADNRGMRGTIRWMAPELMYPEKFGFTGTRLPSKSTDTYALGMAILEVSAFTSSPLPRIEIRHGSLGRLSRGVVRSTASPGNRLLCSRFSKENGRTDRLLGSLTNCGSYWWPLGAQNKGHSPPNVHRRPPSLIGWRKMFVGGGNRLSHPPRYTRKKNVSGPCACEAAWLTYGSIQWKALTRSLVDSRVTVRFIHDRISRPGADVKTMYPPPARLLPPFRPPQVGLNQSIQRSPGSPGIAGKVRQFLRSPRRLLGYLVRPSQS